MRISDWSSDVCSSDLLSLRRQLLDNVMPRLRVQRLVAGTAALPRAHLQHAFWGALEAEKRRALVAVVQRRHEAVLGVEGDVVGARQPLAKLYRILARLDRKRDQCVFHGIALDHPAILGLRSEETSEGKECVSACGSGGAPSH